MTGATTPSGGESPVRLRMAQRKPREATIDSITLEPGAREKRGALLALVIALALALVAVDFATWIQLDVAVIYGLPLVLAGALRSRAMLWSLAASLIAATFLVYALQTPSGSFAPNETFFVNRMLDAFALLLVAGVLHVWMGSTAAREAQSRVIDEQNEKLQAARVARRMVEVQEAERRAVSNRLHDLVGQKLTALSINLNIARNHLSPDPATQVRTRLDDSLKMIEETTESIRDVMAELRPPVLDDFGLAPVLRWYAGEFTQRTGVVTSVVEEGQARRLTPMTEHALFRMAQNALANVAKHARADKAVMTLQTTADSICLTVADNGDGFVPTAVQAPTHEHGWGLMIMRERAAAIGARLSIDSAPGHGTRVVVTLNENPDDQSSSGG